MKLKMEVNLMTKKTVMAMAMAMTKSTHLATPFFLASAFVLTSEVRLGVGIGVGLGGRRI